MARQQPKWIQWFTEKGTLRRVQQFNTWVYQKTGGRLRGGYGKNRFCLLTTLGRKSGKPRTVPLLYRQRGNEVILVASKGGSPKHPLWYENLKAHPEVTMEHHFYLWRQELSAMWR